MYSASTMVRYTAASRNRLIVLGKAYAPLPARDGAGALQAQDPGHIPLVQAAGLAVTAKGVGDAW